MRRRSAVSLLRRAFERTLKTIRNATVRAPKRVVSHALTAASKKKRRTAGVGDWLPGVAIVATGARKFHVYRPSGASRTEPLPLVVMLHGCRQDAAGFALSTRMNRIAESERFFVLYPEQDRLANPQGCWNWYETRSGRAQAEAAIIMQAIAQACSIYPIDPARVAVVGLSAGGSMAALLAILYPDRFRAVVMHSGVPPGAAHSTMSALGAMAGRREPAPLIELSDPMAKRPPLLVIHGVSDAIVATRNADAAVKLWAHAGGAQAGAHRQVQRGKRYAMSVTDFKRRGVLVATLVSIDRLGHAWSGGAAKQAYSDPLGPDASRLAWAFAAKQFRARAESKA